MTSEHVQLVLAIVGALSFLVTTTYAIFTFLTLRQIKRQADLQHSTFLEIKRQTDLQTQALLVVGAEVVPLAATQLSPYILLMGGSAFPYLNSTPSEPRPAPLDLLTDKITKLHEKWSHILDRHKDPAIASPGKLVQLTLRNHGKSGVVSWTVHMKVTVEPGPHLKDNFQIGGEECEWIVAGTDFVAQDGDNILLNVARTGSFPIATFTWSLEYEDMRGVKYKNFAGHRSVTDKNPFATYQQPVPASTPKA